MFQRAKAWGKEGSARHQALSGKKMILLSHLNDCVSEAVVIPAGAVKGDSNTLQYWLYPQQASRPFMFHLNRLYFGTIKL